jgi:hypothetical protein
MSYTIPEIQDINENIPDIQNSQNIHTIYLGDNTTVTGNDFHFGRTSVYLDILPTTDNMVANKSYVDHSLQVLDKKVDTILDGASVSVENFKNFVDFVNNSQRQNEAELYDSINDISFAIIKEVTRAKETEEELKTVIQREVVRAIELENSLLTRIDDINNAVKKLESNDNVRELIDLESSRVVHNLEDSFTEIRISLQNETERSIAEINNIHSTLDGFRTTIDEFKISMQKSIDELRTLISEKEESNKSNDDIITERSRAMESEKRLEDKINLMFNHFFRKSR